MPLQSEQERPALAVVCTTVPPYRQHVHRRITDEIPELRLLTINTHQDNWREWPLDGKEKIGLHDLSRPRPTSAFGSPRAIREAWLDWKQGSETIDLLRQERAAAVIVNGYNDLGRLRVIRWCRQNQIPCFVWGDSNIAAEHRLGFWKAAIKRKYLGWVLRNTSGCFACGSLGAAYWEHYGANQDNVFIAPYEPDYDQITQVTPAETFAAMEKHGLAEGRRRLLFSGRLVSVKRPDLLVEAFVAIAKQRPDWDLVMLGDGPLKKPLDQAIPPAVHRRIHWIPFVDDQRVVSALYRVCDVLVLPSSYEPWALVINEAVAADMAVVASNAVGAAAELVVDGENGFVVPANSLDELRKALLSVTDGQKIDSLKSAAAGRLADWRRRGDPIDGFRKALTSVGVLPSG